MTNSTIIILVLILIILLILGYAIYYIQRTIQQKVRSFSRAIWGTDSITKGIEKQNLEFASTPKSVAGMTSVYLPKIQADFPEFQLDEMKTRAQNVLTSYLTAITQQNDSLLSEGNEDLQNQLKLAISSLQNQHAEEHFDMPHIHRTEITKYQKTTGQCIVTFQSSIEYVHYFLVNGELRSGDRSQKFQARFDVDLLYIQDREKLDHLTEGSMGINCPNCGAPLSKLGAKFCEYCGSPVVEINIHAWSFSAVRESTKL